MLFLNKSNQVKLLFGAALLLLISSCSTEPTPVYTLTADVSPSEAGTVTPATGEYDDGTEVEITATANEHWVFSAWQGQAGGENPLVLTMNADKSVTALFVKREYALNIEVEGEGSVTEQLVTAKTDYEHGSNVQLRAEPSNGWGFVRWEGDLSGSGNPATIVLDEEKDITAVFEAESFAGGGLIDNAQALSNALEFEGGVKVGGTMPSLSNAQHDLGSQERYVITQNSSGNLNFEVGLPEEERPAGAVFLQLEDSNEYFVIPIEDGEVITEDNCAINEPPCQAVSLITRPMQEISFPEEGLTVNASSKIYIPAASEPCCSQLTNNTWDGIDNPDNWSKSIDIEFNAINVGEGAVQITLTWDAQVDLDLHVTEPDGFEIYYGQQTSQNTGGFLDVDNTSGYGPENIFYEEIPPPGDYHVEVVYFSGSVPSNYYVTVNQGGSISTFSGTLSNSDEEHSITTFEGGN